MQSENQGYGAESSASSWANSTILPPGYLIIAIIEPPESWIADIRREIAYYFIFVMISLTLAAIRVMYQ